VQPAVVVGQVGVVQVAGVIEQPDLIPHVEQGNAAIGENQVVQQQDAAHGQVDLVRIAAGYGRFQPRQRSQRATDTPVARFGIKLEDRPSSKRAGKRAAVKVAEKGAVGKAV
jgi:hypothetical protein